MTNWKKYKLREVVEKNRGISYGVVQPGSFSKHGVPFIRVNNLTERKLAINEVERISSEIESKYKRTRLLGNELLISLVGTLGHIGYVTNEMIGWNVARAVGVLPIKDEFDRDWIYWYLKSPAIQEQFHSNATTSVQATLNLKELQEIEIGYPAEGYRQKVVSILSSLDDKIALNRRMNQTLEQMAQTLFKKYFVDDIDGSKTTQVSILDIASLLSGGTPRTSAKEFWDGDIYWISAKDVTPNNGTFILDTERKITQEGIDKSNAKLLPAYSTVITARGTVGNICLLPVKMTISQSNYALKSKLEGVDFVLFQLVQHKLGKLRQNSYGTVFDTITTNTLKDLRVPIPSIDLIWELESKIRPLYFKILSNLKENRTLGLIRDSLLPKLLSGEISVNSLHQNQPLHEAVPC